MRKAFLTKFRQHAVLLVVLLSIGWFAGPLKADVVCSSISTEILVAPGKVAPADCTGTKVETLLAAMTTPWNLSNGLGAGLLTSAVFSGPGNTLSFYYQVTNDVTSANPIERLTASDFTGYLDQGVAFRTDCGTIGCGGGLVNGSVAPVTADRTTDSTIGFDFVSSIFGGMTSNSLIITTHAPAFGDGTAEIIDDSGGTATVTAFRPLPEPMSFVLVVPGLLGLGLLHRKNRKSVSPR